MEITHPLPDCVWSTPPCMFEGVADSFIWELRLKFMLGKFLFPGLKAGANYLLFNNLK
jgi:hypothetical protein